MARVGIALAGLLGLGLSSCGNFGFQSTEPVLQSQSMDFVDSGRGLGAPCRCEGDACQSFGVPRPNLGDIFGCSDLPPDWGGGARVCLRSYRGSRANDTFFANGYCALMATLCDGDGLICGNATMGDYARMVSCPPGSVMLQSTEPVVIELGILGHHEAMVYNKICVAPCAGDADCRLDEHDPALDEPGQYACVQEGAVGFCYDPRNLVSEYFVTQF